MARPKHTQMGEGQCENGQARLNMSGHLKCVCSVWVQWCVALVYMQGCSGTCIWETWEPHCLFLPSDLIALVSGVCVCVSVCVCACFPVISSNSLLKRQPVTTPHTKKTKTHAQTETHAHTDGQPHTHLHTNTHTYTHTHTHTYKREAVWWGTSCQH